MRLLRVTPAASGTALFLLTGCGRNADFRLPELNPARPEARFTWEPRAARRGEVYYNFYSGFDGRTWRTGLATSRDGLAWRKEGVVLAPEAEAGEGGYGAANGSAVFHEGEFWYGWY